MRSKKIFLSLTLFLLFVGYNSCDESRLDVLPQSPTEDAYFIEEVEFERAVTGIYAKLTDFYWYNRSADGCVLPVMILPGDDITTNGQDAFETFGAIQPGTQRLADFFTAAYQLISRAIVVMDKNAAVEDGIYVTPGLRDIHRGEALFLRAYGYYLLWNVFGTAPLVTKRATVLEETTQPSSTGTQLLDQAITDLTEAVELLPDTWPDAQRGRVTKNSGYGLLGKCHVFRATVNKTSADYQAAIAAFDNISGVTLVPAFDDNFAADTENNVESLFEYQATRAFADDNIWLANDFDNAVGALSVFWGFYSNQFNLFGKSPFVATQKLVDAFEEGDPRRELSLDPDTKEFKKYVTRDALNQGGSSSTNNPRILRYADVLLLKAEAINESAGSTVEAIDLINMVRERARGVGAVPTDFSTEETDRNVIRQWIMDERLRELAGEGQRWFDVRRWALGEMLTVDNDFFSSDLSDAMNFEEKNLNFPIPNNETNANLNITQNTGY